MEEFVREKITKLRMLKGVSEYEMSYALGKSKSYINNISAGKTLPSLTGFLDICDYFGITPKEFFDEDHDNSIQLVEATTLLHKLTDEDIEILLPLMRRMAHTE